MTARENYTSINRLIHDDVKLLSKDAQPAFLPLRKTNKGGQM